MTFAEKVIRGIMVALPKRGNWRDNSAVFALREAKYLPHQGARECARRLKQQQRVSA